MPMAVYTMVRVWPVVTLITYCRTTAIGYVTLFVSQNSSVLVQGIEGRIWLRVVPLHMIGVRYTSDVIHHRFSQTISSHYPTSVVRNRVVHMGCIVVLHSSFPGMLIVHAQLLM
jgi:hypothetical protein